MKFENCKIPYIMKNGRYLTFKMMFDVESTEDNSKLIDLIKDYCEFNLNVEVTEVREPGQPYKKVKE